MHDIDPEYQKLLKTLTNHLIVVHEILLLFFVKNIKRYMDNEEKDIEELIIREKINEIFDESMTSTTLKIKEMLYKLAKINDQESIINKIVKNSETVLSKSTIVRVVKPKKNTFDKDITQLIVKSNNIGDGATNDNKKKT